MGEEDAELIVVPNRQLNMPWVDAHLLVVLRRVHRQLHHLPQSPPRFTPHTSIVAFTHGHGSHLFTGTSPPAPSSPPAP